MKAEILENTRVELSDHRLLTVDEVADLLSVRKNWLYESVAAKKCPFPHTKVDLRHTFGSVKMEHGANVYYVMKQMGHSSIQVTVGVYAHELESRKPEEAARTDEYLFGTKTAAVK